jgi:hypothetical protein
MVNGFFHPPHFFVSRYRPVSRAGVHHTGACGGVNRKFEEVFAAAGCVEEVFGWAKRHWERKLLGNGTNGTQRTKGTNGTQEMESTV